MEAPEGPLGFPDPSDVTHVELQITIMLIKEMDI